MAATKSLKLNVIANYIGLFYTAIIGVVVLPLYLQYLGAEAFGLVGFFLVLQAWMQLLDMGMSPMLSRQAAYARGKITGYLELKKLLRCLELIFFILGLLVVIGITVGSRWITDHWLNTTTLVTKDVATCIVMMGVTISMCFYSSLYRSGTQGMEYQVILNIANTILVTLKFVGSLVMLIYITQDIVYFFCYQLLIGVIEIITITAIFYYLVPPTEKVRIGFYWDTVKSLLPFAGGIAYAAAIWVILTQLDKLILSNILTLSEYGYFTLVAIISAGIVKVSSPISQAILPRMTYLLSQNKEQDMLALYRKSSKVMAAIILPLTGVVALYSTELVFAWTGDRKAAEWAGPVLFWFSLGNGILAISAFQFYLQFAHGKLKLHVLYNTVSAIIQIPLIIYTAYKYGALGVALTWFILRLLAFIIWTPIVHSKFAPGIHWAWLKKDIMPAFLITFSFLVFLSCLDLQFQTMGRMEIFGHLFFTGSFLLSICVLSYPEFRSYLFRVARGHILK